MDAALDRIHRDASAATRHEQPLPTGTRPGFLVALAELIDAGVHHFQPAAIVFRERALALYDVQRSPAFRARFGERELAAGELEQK